jgi:hypothetical protein
MSVSVVSKRGIVLSKEANMNNKRSFKDLSIAINVCKLKVQPWVLTTRSRTGFDGKVRPVSSPSHRPNDIFVEYSNEPFKFQRSNVKKGSEPKKQRSRIIKHIFFIDTFVSLAIPSLQLRLTTSLFSNLDSKN